MRFTAGIVPARGGPDHPEQGPTGEFSTGLPRELTTSSLGAHIIAVEMDVKESPTSDSLRAKRPSTPGLPIKEVTVDLTRCTEGLANVREKGRERNAAPHEEGGTTTLPRVRTIESGTFIKPSTIKRKQPAGPLSARNIKKRTVVWDGGRKEGKIVRKDNEAT